MSAETVCARCTKPIRADGWGRWVDDNLWTTCGGDRPHQPVAPGSSR